MNDFDEFEYGLHKYLHEDFDDLDTRTRPGTDQPIGYPASKPTSKLTDRQLVTPSIQW